MVTHHDLAHHPLCPQPLGPRTERSVHFLLEADPSPCLLPRVLQPLARRSLIPDHLHAYRLGDRMQVELTIHFISDESANLVEGNLRQLVGVRRITRLQPVQQQAA